MAISKATYIDGFINIYDHNGQVSGLVGVSGTGPKALMGYTSEIVTILEVDLVCEYNERGERVRVVGYA